MTEPEKRPPSFTKQIRTLLQKADLDGKRFTAGDILLLSPNADLWSALPEVGQARAEFIAAACNHFIAELALEREAVKIAQGYTAAEQQAREGKGRRR